MSVLYHTRLLTTGLSSSNSSDIRMDLNCTFRRSRIGESGLASLYHLIIGRRHHSQLMHEVDSVIYSIGSVMASEVD
eukprot:scaffold87995_cov87-Attheya_sp.AAC.2